MAYTTAGELLAGVPMLDAPDRMAFSRLLNTGVVAALGVPGAYTARGRQFDSVVKYLMGADERGNDLPLHETGDVWVPLSLEQSYRRRTIAAGTDHLLVQRVVRAPSHCQFYGDTRDRAFDDLVAWIERGVKPEGEDVLASDLSRIGLKWTPALHPEDPLAPKR